MCYRNLLNDERELILRITTYQSHLPYGSEIKIGERVKQFASDGSLVFPDMIDAAKLRHNIYPVEAQFIDDDGIYVHALVFVTDNNVYMLEIYKDDGSPITRKPKPEDWEIVDLTTSE